MNLTPEEKEVGRRRFLTAVAAPPALAEVEKATADAPLRGGAVRVGFIGVGRQGRVLLERSDPAFADVQALCDINPSQIAAADEVLKKAGRPPARPYAEWREMLEKESFEAVIVAVPLWLHADLAVAAMEAGKHVLCEKMMAWDVPSCERMAEAARKTGRVLEIGYQRYYNPVYLAAYHGIIRSGLLGEVYHARLAWHRNENWRRKGDPPSPDYDPSRWGYPTFDHLYNWRLYWRYSKGLFAELGSHQVNVANWFFGAKPEGVSATGGVNRFKDGREVQDHVYATFDYPGGRNATFSSIESNAFEDNYEAFFGTKGTLVMSGEREAYLLDAVPPDNASTARRSTAPAVRAARLETDADEDVPERRDDVPERRASEAVGWSEPTTAGEGGRRRLTSSRIQISTFCAAVRGGKAVACGPEKALVSARACIGANEAAEKKVRLNL